MEKRDFLDHMYAPADMDAMRRLRRAMDPRFIANPGFEVLIFTVTCFAAGKRSISTPAILPRSC
jgi:hypothetical protein